MEIEKMIKKMGKIYIYLKMMKMITLKQKKKNIFKNSKMIK